MRDRLLRPRRAAPLAVPGEDPREAVMLTTDIAPPNSLILIMDRSIGEIPESMAGA